ncbi:MAG: hypothetical protein OEV40_30165 [Acidimicrobiia bacterium]|nr:hypothetical protein [Acidimicrobiia bacterium]
MAIDPTAIGSVDEAVDHLYGLEPERFVAARNELARALRADGDRSAADSVKALRKPTVVAAELNRVLRSSPTELDELLRAAADLAGGHRSVLDGETVELGGLQAAHREVTRRLAGRAERHQERLEALLEAASLDETQHDQLRAASFAAEPTPAAGFDLFPPRSSSPPASITSLAEVRARRRESASKRGQAEQKGQPAAGDGEGNSIDREPERPSQSRPGQRRAAEVLAAAATEHGRAETSLTIAYRRVEAAVRKVGKARERIDDLERRLADARAHYDEAEDGLAAATTAAEKAEQRLSASADALRAARVAVGEPLDEGGPGSTDTRDPEVRS